MGIARAYNRIIRRQLERHAAWLPVTNIYTLGDFGMVSGGLFTRIGNVADLGVRWTDKPGPPSRIDYSSSSVRTTRIQGGVEVDAFAPGSNENSAQLSFEFTRKNTFIIQAAELTSQEMDNVFSVAEHLSNHPQWRRRFRFVTSVYEAQSPLLLASHEGQTKVTLSGKVEALEQARLGKANGDFDLSASKELALEITGTRGVIGLQLARVTFTGQPRLRTALRDGGEAPREIGVEFDSDWDEDPDDDI